MKVLVTGATGFVGARLTEALRAAGHETVGVARSALTGPGPGTLATDLSVEGEAAQVLERVRPDAVVNLAAIADIQPCTNNPRLAHALNVRLPGELARACHADGVRLVHVSTDQVFDGSHGGWTEDDIAQPLHAYGETKLAGEQVVAAAMPAAAIVRPGLVTGVAHEGRRSATSGLLDALQRAAAGGDRPVFFTDEIRSPIAVEDLVRVLVELCTTPRLSQVAGLLHAGGDEVLTRNQLAQAEAARHGLDAALIGAGTRADSGVAHLRPADLSLDSGRLVTSLGWAPRALVP